MRQSSLLKSININLGLPADEIVPVYKALRHELAHMVAPRDGYTVVALLSEEAEYESVKGAMQARSEDVLSFVRQPSGWQCFVDILAFDLERIADWLVNRINNNEYNEDAVKRATEWLRRQLS